MYYEIFGCLDQYTFCIMGLQVLFYNKQMHSESELLKAISYK